MDIITEINKNQDERYPEKLFSQRWPRLHYVATGWTVAHENQMPSGHFVGANQYQYVRPVIDWQQTHAHNNLNSSLVTRQHILRLLPLLFVLGQLGLSCHCACRRSCVLLGLTMHWITDENTWTHARTHTLSLPEHWHSLTSKQSVGTNQVRARAESWESEREGRKLSPSVLLIELFDWQQGRAVERRTLGWQEKERKRASERQIEQEEGGS